MNDSIHIPLGTQRYTELLDALDGLAREFHTIGDLSPFLFLESVVPDRPLSESEWDAFHCADESDRAPDEWAWWVRDPDGWIDQRFRGDEHWFDLYCRLAECTYHVLKEISLTLPDLSLPPSTANLDQKFHDYDEPYLVWTELVERAARLQTPLLRHLYSHWGIRYERAALSNEQSDDIEGREIDLPNGVSFPEHPLVTSLATNLFRSSGEAIEIIRGVAKCCYIGDDWDYCNIVLLEPGTSIPYPRAPAARQIDDAKAYFQALEPGELILSAKTLRPRYDRDTRILYFGDWPVRQLGSASSQEALLLTFEDAGWLEMIDNPLKHTTDGLHAARDATSLCRLYFIKGGWPILLNLRAQSKQQHVTWEIMPLDGASDGSDSEKTAARNDPASSDL